MDARVKLAAARSRLREVRSLVRKPGAAGLERAVEFLIPLAREIAACGLLPEADRQEAGEEAMELRRELEEAGALAQAAATFYGHCARLCSAGALSYTPQGGEPAAPAPPCLFLEG